MDKDKSISEKIEILETVQPVTSVTRHKEWLMNSLKDLQDEFQVAENAKDKIALFNTIASFVSKEEKNPMVIMKAIQELPERKLRILLAVLDKENLIKQVKKTTTKKVFK